MFFRSRIGWTLAIVALIVGCHPMVGDNQALIPTPRNKIGTEARCVANSTAVLKNFFSGETTPQKVSDAWTCFDGAFDLFGKKVRGANPNFYHASEIGDFLETYILTDGTKVSSGLMTEILRLKQLLVGGEEDRITRNELAALRAMTRQVSALMVEVLPQMKIYAGHWDIGSNRPLAKAEFAKAELELEISLATHWPRFKGSYDLQNLQNLANQLQKSFPSTSGIQTFQKAMTKYLPIVISVKNIILNDRKAAIDPQDWAKLLKQLPAIYGRSLFVTYFMKDSWFWGEGLADFDLLIRKSLSCLEGVFLARGDGVPVGITIDELNSLADGVGSAGFFGKHFGADTLKSLIPVLVKRLLTPPDQRLAGNPETTLGGPAIQTFLKEYDGFMSTQHKLDQMWTLSPMWTHANLQSALKASPETELASVVESPLALSFDSQDRLYLDVGKEISYSKDSALKLNIVRALTRLAIRSYAKEAQRVNDVSALTKSEVQTDLFGDFRAVLVNAGLIQPTSLTFARNRFIEANLFTPLANGDEILDFREGSSIALMIWSGINLNSALAIKSGCLVGPSLNEYSAECAMEQMRAEVPTVATSMPLMGTTLFAMPKADGHKMLMDLLIAAGWEPNAAGIARSSDIGLVPHVLQYIESVFRRWDLNADAILDKPEVLAAEPTFRPLLKVVSGQTDPAVLRAGFAYIVAYQKNPMDDPFDFLDFMGDESKWVINVDRPAVGRILGFIANQIRKKNPSPAPAGFQQRRRSF